jgi:transcriptional regulator GlxA family with amidase domain
VKIAESIKVIPVYVIVPPRALLLDIAGPVEALRKANLEQSAVRYSVTYHAVRGEMSTSIGLQIGGLSRFPDHLPDQATVLISGAADDPLSYDPNQRQQDEADEAIIVRWLASSIRPGIRLISICSGALLAARAGLLDGYECATHHGTIETLKKIAPKAIVRENRLFVQHGDRLTSAGVTSGIDLMLAVISRDIGHNVAAAIAQYLVVYLRRAGDDPQISLWLEGRNHLHQAVHRVQDAVTADPTRAWSVASLAKQAAVSPRNLSRIFNSQSGMSVTDYVNRMRVALAGEYLRHSLLDLEHVAEKAGFSSTRHFRRAWRRFYNIPPSEWRRTARNRDVISR